jgi:hypothetical protein
MEYDLPLCPLMNCVNVKDEAITSMNEGIGLKMANCYTMKCITIRWNESNHPKNMTTMELGRK